MSGPETAPVETRNPYAVLRNGDFLSYLVGRLVAVLGQQMLTVAVGWELYERTGSSLALGMVGLSEMTAMVLLTLPAGHLADNYNRKRIIMVAMLVSVASSLGLAAISALHGPVCVIYACLFTTAAARTFMWPASSAFLTSLFIGTSNELGGFESGFLAYLAGPVFSVVFGGIGTILIVIAVALIWPEIRRYGKLEGG